MQAFRGPILTVMLALPVVLHSGTATAEDNTATGTLVTRVQGLSSSDGNLRFVLFASEEDFLKTAFRAEIVEIENGQGTWTVEDLPHGEYAVLVHHDVNANGEMERHWYGKPKEPNGVSNDAPAKFGPPKYKKAKFLFESPTKTLTITVR